MMAKSAVLMGLVHLALGLLGQAKADAAFPTQEHIKAALRPAYTASTRRRTLQQAGASTSAGTEQTPEQMGGLIETPLSRALAAGQDGLRNAEPRPFKLAWQVRMGASLRLGSELENGQETLNYVEQRLLPALNSFMGRSIRVRVR